MKKRILLLSFIALSSMCAFAQNVPSYVPSNGLVGWWPFNGNANDESGNGNNGTVNGATLTTDRFGLSNKAYSFDGLSNEIAITNSLLNLGLDFTIICWMNSSDITKTQQCLFNSINHTGFVVELNNENIPPNKLTYGVGPSNAFWDLIYAQGSFNGFQNNNWYHIVFVRTGTTYTLYVNNIFDGSANVLSSNSYTQNVGLRIGSIGGAEFFQGNIDDIGIWNRALTQQEITDLYNGTSAQTNENSLPLASVHPNPTTREITITSNDLHSQFYSLYNSLGQLVASGMLNAENTTLSIQEFAPGIYTLQLQGEKNTTLKIVKE